LVHRKLFSRFWKTRFDSKNAVEDILKLENLAIDIKKDNLISILENTTKSATKKVLGHFNLNVPHRFFSPW
jgi:hypothetical protein